MASIIVPACLPAKVVNRIGKLEVCFKNLNRNSKDKPSAETRDKHDGQLCYKDANKIEFTLHN